MGLEMTLTGVDHMAGTSGWTARGQPKVRADKCHALDGGASRRCARDNAML